MAVKIYDLKMYNGTIVQRYAGSNFTDEQVITHCENLYNARNRQLYLFKDGKLIYRYLKLNKNNTPILDRSSGYIYKNIHEMCDNLNISIYKAFCIIKTKYQYEWVK